MSTVKTQRGRWSRQAERISRNDLLNGGRYSFMQTAVCFLLLALLSCVCIPAIGQEAGPEGIAIDEKTFPDEAFRKYLQSNAYGCEDGYLSEDDIAHCLTFYMSSLDIRSLQGIEVFTSLEVLECQYAKISGCLDLSSNTALKKVYCFNNQVSSIKLGSCPNLQTLWTSFNILTELDISQCPVLRDMVRGAAPQGGLDDCRLLWGEQGENTAFLLTDIEVDVIAGDYTFFSPVTEEKHIAPDEAHFPDPVFRKYVQDVWDYDQNGILTYGERQRAMEDFEGMGIGSLKGIEYARNSLTSLYCDKNNLTELDLSGFGKLNSLDCSNNRLASLNLSGCSAMIYLYCDDNQLEELVLKDMPQLNQLGCRRNKLKTLLFPDSHGLDRFYCNDNELTELDLTNQPMMTDLTCNNNRISSLDLRSSEWLLTAACQNNQLTELLTGKKEYLLTFACAYNRLTGLDVSQCPVLQLLDCQENQLTEINLQSCAELDILTCSGNRLTELDVSRNAKLRYLFCSDNFSLRKLDVSHNPELEYLRFVHDPLTEIDLSRNPKLQDLVCYGCYLKTLDVSACPVLVNLIKSTERIVEKNYCYFFAYPAPNTMYEITYDLWVTVTAGDVVVEAAEPDQAPEPPDVPDPDQPDRFAVILETEGRGTAEADPPIGTTGTKVTLTATPDPGWVFREWRVIYGDAVIENNTFTIGTCAVKILAVFEPEMTTDEGVMLDLDAGSGTAEVTGVNDSEIREAEIPAAVKDAAGKSYKVVRIADGAFEHCEKLKKVSIGKNVRIIGKNAFRGCAGLTSVSGMDGVTEIGDGAFRECGKLTGFTIGKKVVKIGKNAFNSCGKLKNITIRTVKLKKKSFGKDCFKGISKKAVFMCPKKTLKNYKNWIRKPGGAPDSVIFR